MAFSDADFISKEKHELDYVLKKWEKRTTQANRDILANALDAFRKDPANKPFTRDIFYLWAEKNSLKVQFESKESNANSANKIITEENKDIIENTFINNKDSLETKNISDNKIIKTALTIENKEQAPFNSIIKNSSVIKKLFPSWRKWVFASIIIIAVIILIFLLLRGCVKNSESSPSVSKINIINAPKEEAKKQSAKILTLDALPSSSLSLRFIEASSSILIKEDELKLSALIKVLKEYDSGILLLTGWCANFGDPRLDQSITLARAEYIKQRLTKSGISSGIIIKTIGRGATGKKDLNSLANNRRVDVSVE